MKKQILKIAGVKSEKEFYKKYPDEASFMKAHGKAFKKAQIGAYIGGEKDAGFQPIPFKDVYDQVDYSVTGSTEDQRVEQARRNAEVAAAQQSAQGGGGGGIGAAIGNLGQVFQAMGGEEGMAALAGARKGKSIKKAQVGDVVGTPMNLQPPPGTNYAWTNFNTQPPPVNPNQPRQYAMQTVGTPVNQGEIIPIGGVEEKPGGDFAKTLGKYAGPAGKIVEGIQQLKEEKRALERATQARDVSGLVKQAASTRPEQTERRYVRPEDITNTGEEFFPIYGVGTNVLAKDGASVGGGEIMNTFAPNTLYDNLGYEPLNESERYKQFFYGGKMHTAQNGDWMEGSDLYNFANSGGTDATGQLITGITGENAGGNIGGTLGKTAGTLIGGPVGGLIGQAAGQLIGAAVDRKPQQIKKAKAATQRNIQATALQQGVQGGQAQYTSFMEDGGTTSPYAWMSHTWQPQVIAQFDGNNVSKLLSPPKDADMLRAGGHLKEYTPPSAAAMSTERPNFAMGGELQTHWGGYAEPMSQNPYLPDGGQTIMFRGQSHDESDGKGNTGIGITYGENPVEVERGEPAVKLKDGTGGDSSLVVFGNLKIPKAYIPFLGEDAKGKKFKTYVSDLSKKENRINNKVNKALNELDEFTPQTSFDRLKFNSLDLTINGGNAKLKDIADKKISAASLQNAINDTAEEYGLIADDLAKGRVKMDKNAFQQEAKYGKQIRKAQGGISTPSDEDWIRKILQYESEHGSASGGGLSNFGYNDWQKLGHSAPPSSLDEAVKYFKKDFLPKVKDFPMDLRKRLADYNFNTGRSINDIMLYAAGKISLDDINSAKTFNDEWNKYGKDILKEYKDNPSLFTWQLDKAKHDVYSTTKASGGQPNPAYYNTWAARIDMWDPVPPQQAQPAQTAQQTPIPDGRTTNQSKRAQVMIARDNTPVPVTEGTTPVDTNAHVTEIMDLYQKAKEENDKHPGKKNTYTLQLQKKYHEYFPEIAEQIITKASGVTAKAKKAGIKNIEDLKKRSRSEILETNLDEYFGPRTEQYIAALPKDTPVIPDKGLDIPKKTDVPKERVPATVPTVPITPYKRNTLVDIFGQVLPYLRPSDTEGLDPNQLMGEMYALATNQLEPVQAQTLQPQLTVPYDISYQDILNENEAAFRSQQRLAGYNPAAQAQLNAQKYQANQRVLGEQFRQNQAMKNQVYRENRNILNEYGLKNMEILDRQYVRQAEAKSKTKAITQAALNSIGDKYMRNQLENRTLAVMENMYNYRYDPRFRTVNVNAPFQPQIPTVYNGQQGVPVLDDQGNVINIPSTATPPLVPMGSVPAAAPAASPVQPLAPVDYEDQMLTEDELKGYGKRGIKVGKKKGLNSSILKAFKNI